MIDGLLPFRRRALTAAAAFDETLYDGPFLEEYGAYASLGDLFRQIGHDERVHKDESLARMAEPRFR